MSSSVRIQAARLELATDEVTLVESTKVELLAHRSLDFWVSHDQVRQASNLDELFAPFGVTPVRRGGVVVSLAGRTSLEGPLALLWDAMGTGIAAGSWVVYGLDHDLECVARVESRVVTTWIDPWDYESAMFEFTRDDVEDVTLVTGNVTEVVRRLSGFSSLGEGILLVNGSGAELVAIPA